MESSRLTQRIERFITLFRRYRVDGTLPASTSGLVRDLCRSRLTRIMAYARATARNPSRQLMPQTPFVNHLGRSLPTNGVLSGSTDALSHDNAAFLVSALQAEDIDIFLVERTRDSFHFGTTETDRTKVWQAICNHGEPTIARGIESTRGRHRTVANLKMGDVPNPIARSTKWNVFKILDSPTIAEGVDCGAVLSFWSIGSSMQLEQLGVRGQARFDPRSKPTVENIDGHIYPGLSAFPVSRAATRFTEPIDVVFTWVDGMDPQWLESYNHFAALDRRGLDSPGRTKARYRSRDELRYALRSVSQYAGWVRRIYIVTSGQRPDWIVEDDRLRLVPHTEILPPADLPTFNSHAIETALHRIEGLAEHFLYFNDDFFLGRPTRPELFFNASGKALIFPSDARIPGVEDSQTPAVDTAAIRTQELLLQRFGKTATHKLRHAPYALRRSTMQAVQQEFSEQVQQTSASRFRAATDVCVAASLAAYYGLLVGDCMISEPAIDYCNVESPRLAWHLDRLTSSTKFDAFCLNETDIDGDETAIDTMIAAFLAAHFPTPSPWEN
jgi:hypothetical protein